MFLKALKLLGSALDPTCDAVRCERESNSGQWLCVCFEQLGCCAHACMVIMRCAVIVPGMQVGNGRTICWVVSRSAHVDRGVHSQVVESDLHRWDLDTGPVKRKLVNICCLSTATSAT